MQEETILKLGDEINRLSAFESECSHKDTLIAELQREISTMNEKVVATLAKKDTEFHQKLASLDKESEAKAEEIRRLKEQVGWCCSVRVCTCVFFAHPCAKRALVLCGQCKHFLSRDGSR